MIYSFNNETFTLSFKLKLRPFKVLLSLSKKPLKDFRTILSLASLI